MAAVAEGLFERQVATLRYQFPFVENGSGRPDSPLVAHATIRAAVAEAAQRLSSTMDAAFCIEALHKALARFGRLEIFNTDQGSQPEFNRSSQQPCGLIEDARQTPRLASSSQGSCAAWC